MLTCRFTWTETEALAAESAAYRQNFRLAFRFAAASIALLAVAVSIAMAAQGHLNLQGLFFGLGGVYWLAIRRAEARWRLRRKFARSIDRNKSIEFRITEQDVETYAEAIGQSRVAWLYFSKLAETKTGFLLYPQSGNYLWLPKPGFEPGGADQFAELARAKVATFIGRAQTARPI